MSSPVGSPSGDATLVDMHVVENLMRSSDTTRRASVELESRTSDSSRASDTVTRGGSPGTEFWSPRGARPEGLDGTELEGDLDWDFSPVSSDLD